MRRGAGDGLHHGADGLRRAQDVTVTFTIWASGADAALITAEDGSRILIDAGTNKGGKKLAERFAEEGIERLDAMIITHFDKDHVGGADKILKAFPSRG